MLEAREFDRWEHTTAVAYPLSLILWMLGQVFGSDKKEPPQVEDVNPVLRKAGALAVDPEKARRAREEADRLNREIQQLMLIGDQAQIDAYFKARNERRKHTSGESSL